MKLRFKLVIALIGTFLLSFSGAASVRVRAAAQRLLQKRRLPLTLILAKSCIKKMPIKHYQLHQFQN